MDIYEKKTKEKNSRKKGICFWAFLCSLKKWQSVAKIFQHLIFIDHFQHCPVLIQKKHQSVLFVCGGYGENKQNFELLDMSFLKIKTKN